LVGRLRAERPGLDVVYMSGYTAGILADQHGTSDVVLLHKPFAAEELLAVVERAVHRSVSS
jgi:FixJ family two-component response regulator